MYCELCIVQEPKEDNVLGVIWSDDETCLTDCLGYHHGDLQDVETLKPELSKYEPINYLSSQFITIRRKSKRKGSIFSERKRENDLVDSARTLSYDDCVSTAMNETPIIDWNKSMHEDENEICTVKNDISKESAECSIKLCDNFERTERHFSKDLPSTCSSSSENGVNKDAGLIEQNIKSGVVCASEITGNILTSVSVTDDSRKYDAVSADAKSDRCNEEQIKILCKSFDFKGDQDILQSDDESYKCISNIKIYSPSNEMKLTIPVTTISSGSGSDYDCVWESEDESVVSKFKSETKIQEINYTKHPVQLLNKGQCTVNLKTPITEKEIGCVTPTIIQHRYVSFIKNIL